MQFTYIVGHRGPVRRYIAPGNTNCYKLTHNAEPVVRLLVLPPVKGRWPISREALYVRRTSIVELHLVQRGRRRREIEREREKNGETAQTIKIEN